MSAAEIKPKPLHAPFSRTNQELFCMAARQAMRKQGLTSAALGAMLGVSRARVTQILNLDSPLTVGNALSVAAVLGLTVGAEDLLPEAAQFATVFAPARAAA